MWVRYELLENAEIEIEKKYPYGFFNQPMIEVSLNFPQTYFENNNFFGLIDRELTRFLIIENRGDMYEMILTETSTNYHDTFVKLQSINPHYKTEYIPQPSKKGIYIAIQTPNCRIGRNPDELAEYPLDFECPALKRMMPLENLNCFGNKIFLY